MADSFKTATVGEAGMQAMNTPDLHAAESFLAGSARVLERRCYERIFSDGAAQPVRDAVAAYRNSDGGFGHGLEPDGRTPSSQPPAVELALRILNESDAWDEQLVTGACDWLLAHAPPGGGATFVEPTVEGWPHAPWWSPQQGNGASLTTTGLIAGTLHTRGVEHPWLDGATVALWPMLDNLSHPDAYEMRGALAFLQHVPDRVRADQAFERVGSLLVEQGLVALDPKATGEVHTPLNFAPEPTSLARRLFDAPTIDAHLEHLAAGQADDGGWTFNWFVWSSAAQAEWRGCATVEALRVLKLNGRL
jgi:hypothetical protein